ncbi:sigma-70 family RNA polymerase sigma factor [Clostridium sp. MB05]|uniref:sigma-70 family RNA polymerase sigma factor n=1 Tax=Clostridium sp. MB05 TaxID=3376682 RepID=UPI003982BE3D
MNQLIKKAKQGDKKAMEEILNSFEPLVYKTSISYYIYGCDTEDIKQITRLTIIKLVDKFNIDLSESFSAYVQKGIRNQMYKEIEKATKKYYDNKLNKEIVSSIDIKEIVDKNTNITEDYIKKELRESLYNVIEKLKSSEKALLNSLYVKGITLKDYSKSQNIEYHKMRYMKDKIIEKLRKEVVI